MAKIEMKVPSPGESITEVQISRWLKKDGDYVEKDEELCEVDSDKATLTLNAETSGAIKILAKEGDTIKVGSVVCTIDDSVAAPVAAKVKQEVVATAASEAVKTPVKEKLLEKPETYAQGIPSVAAEKLMREKNISAASPISNAKFAL